RRRGRAGSAACSSVARRPHEVADRGPELSGPDRLVRPLRHSAQRLRKLDRTGGRRTERLACIVHPFPKEAVHRGDVLASNRHRLPATLLECPAVGATVPAFEDGPRPPGPGECFKTLLVTLYQGPP
ncbi:MAG: hypothetical protein BJ554DRAFT_2575, partial [Olpidium bornovanus]